VAGKIQEYFVIPPDYVATGLITRYTQKTELEPPSDVMYATQSVLIDNLLKGKVDEVTERTHQSASGLSNVSTGQDGNVAEGQNGWGAYAISYLFAILLVMSIFTASGYSSPEDSVKRKKTRIMECCFRR
jgi:ABC-2 type transport system permease protein